MVPHSIRTFHQKPSTSKAPVFRPISFSAPKYCFPPPNSDTIDTAILTNMQHQEHAAPGGIMERPTTYMGDQPYIFVSYSHKDSDRVWPIISKLQADGYRVWYDDGISPGTEWDAMIAKQIRKCAFFLAFITANYLASDNCKDELAFVRDLNKNRVLNYLEEVILPDEMQMRLGRLQAIYWNRDGEKKSYDKLELSPGLNSCREPSAPAPSSAKTQPAIASPAPASASPASASANASPAAPTNATPANATTKAAPTDTSPASATTKSAPADASPANEPTPAPASASAQTQPAKKPPFLFIGVGAAVLIALVVIITSMGSSKSTGGTASTETVKQEASTQETNIQTDSTPKEQDASQPKTGTQPDIILQDASSLTGPYSVYKSGVYTNKNTPLAGVLKIQKYESYTFREQQNLDYNGDTYTVAKLPFMTISSYDDQNSIILGFLDKFEAPFYFYGTYKIDGDTLTISPGGSAGTFDQDCAPLTQEISYPLSMSFFGVEFDYENDYVYLPGYQDDSNTIVVKGALSKDSQSYRGIKSLDLVFDLETNEAKKCVLILEDNGVTATANIKSVQYSDSFHDFSIDWSSVEYTLNGRPVTEDGYGYVSFEIVNQYPAGFMIVNDASKGNLYYYQDLSEF